MVLRLMIAALLLAAFGLALGGCAGGDNPPGTATLLPNSATTELDETIAFWQGRVDQDASDFVAQNRLGNTYLERAQLTGGVGDYSSAEAAYTASNEALPANPGALFGLALVAMAQHDFEGALDLADRLRVEDASEEGAEALRGDALMALGRYEEAGEAYERFVAEAPGLESLGRRAILETTLGDVAAAEGTWNEALSDEYAPPAQLAWGLAEYGRLRFAIGAYEAAMDLYERALESQPGYLPAVIGLADALAATGEADQAIALYEGVIERAPSPETAVKLGDTLAAEGRLEEAQRQYGLVEAFQALYEANGVSADLAMVLYLADHGRAREAVERARVVYEARPGVYAADALGWALAQDGQYEEALVYAREATRFGTPEARFFYHAGVIHERLGAASQAEQLLSRALELSPRFSARESADAERLLAELASRVGLAE